MWWKVQPPPPLPPQLIYKIQGNKRAEYERKEEEKQDSEGERWGGRMKKSSIRNHRLCPRGKSQDSSDSSKDFGDQCQHHTTNESAPHARVSTPHKYSCFLLSSLKLGMCVLIITMRPWVTGNWFDLHLFKAGWAYVLFYHNNLFTVTLRNKLI